MEVDQETTDGRESSSNKLEVNCKDKFFLTDENKVLVRLSVGEKIYVRGQVNVEAVCGVLEVLGSYIRPTDGVKTVFSPRGYSLLYIGAQEGKDPSDCESKLNEYLDKLTFQDNDEVRRIVEASKSSVFALLSRVPDETDCINLYLKHSVGGGLRLFAKDDNKFRPLPTTLKDAENVLNINMAFSQQEIGSRLFQIGAQWETAVLSAKITAEGGAKPRLLIAGGKGVGKSTLARYIVNRLMGELGTPVLFIDVDPGQAEFSLPGTLSCTIVQYPVLGPNFTHTHWKKEMCFYLGSVDVGSCRDRYIASMIALKKFCKSHCDIPWVINTMGFTKGLGSTLISKTLKAFKPSTIIEIVSRSRNKNFDSADFFARNCSSLKLRCNVLRFEAVPESINDTEIRCKDNWGIPQPSLLRDIVILSHLKSAFLSQPILKVVPRAVTWSEVYLQIIDLETSFSTPNLVRILNMSFVCLGRVEELDLPQRNPYKLNLVTPPDLVTPAMGFGIIRSIDVKRNIFYIITDLPDEIIKNVNILTYGSKIRLPEGIIARQQPDGKRSTPYLAKNETKSLLATPWERSFKPKQINH